MSPSSQDKLAGGLVLLGALAVGALGAAAILAIYFLRRDETSQALMPAYPDAVFLPAPEAPPAKRTEVYSAGLTTTSSIVASAPLDAPARVRVRVVAPAGAYVALGFNSASVSAAASSPSGNITIVAVGSQDAKFTLAPGQILLGASNVDGTIASVTSVIG